MVADEDWSVAHGTEVLLIRHGETQWNADQRIQGHLDVGLSERGLEQVKRLAARLLEEPLDAVYTSDLQRARLTAEAVAGGRVQVQVDPRVREADMGLFQGLTAAECRETHPEAYEGWRQDSVRNRPPNGETLEDLQVRCMGALREILARHSGGRVAIISHGGSVRVMGCGLLGLPLEVYPRLRVENTSIARILYHYRGFILGGWNDTAHLRASSAVPAHSGWEER